MEGGGRGRRSGGILVGFHRMAIPFIIAADALALRDGYKDMFELLMFQDSCGGLFLLQMPETFLCFIKVTKITSLFQKGEVSWCQGS